MTKRGASICSPSLSLPALVIFHISLTFKCLQAENMNFQLHSCAYTHLHASKISLVAIYVQCNWLRERKFLYKAYIIGYWKCKGVTLVFGLLLGTGAMWAVCSSCHHHWATADCKLFKTYSTDWLAYHIVQLE